MTRPKGVMTAKRMKRKRTRVKSEQSGRAVRMHNLALPATTQPDYTASPGEELAADGSLSPPRELSRSPPRSRSPSPSSLAKMTAALSISSQHQDIKDIVSSDLTKERARQRQKYHSKRGAHRIGRPKGSKAKQDSRVKVDKSGFWE